MVLHLQRKIKNIISIITIGFLLMGTFAMPVYACEPDVDNKSEAVSAEHASDVAGCSNESMAETETKAETEDKAAEYDDSKTSTTSGLDGESEQADSQTTIGDESQSQIKVKVSIKVIASETGDKDMWLEEATYVVPTEDATKGMELSQLTKLIENEETCHFEYDAKGRIMSISAPESKSYAGKQAWHLVVDGQEVEADKATKNYLLFGGEKVEFIYDEEKTSSNDEISDQATLLKSGDSLLKASKSEIDDKYGNTRDKLLKECDELGWPYESEFSVVGNARAGYMTEERKNAYCNNIVNKLKSTGNSQLSTTQSSDNSRVVLALTSMGVNPADVDGYNLLEPLSDMNFLTRQGMNGPLWALMAFDCGNYEIPKVKEGGQQVTRDGLVDFLLRAQRDDGGWAYSGNSDIDMTAMAIQALTPYYNTNSKVKAAVDKGLQWLSSNQNKDGFFTTGSLSSESQSQVIVALTGLGIDPAQDERFVKNGKGAIDSLLSFYCDGGGFKHVNSNWKANGLATIQGNYALVAYYRYINGQTGLYNMGSPSDYIIDVDYNTDEDDTKPEVKPEDGKEDDGASGDGKVLTRGITKSLSLLKISKEEPINKKLGKKYHYDAASGIDMRGNDETVLPWYVKLNVKKRNLTPSQEKRIVKALGESGSIYYSYDISFINTKDDSRWEPDGVINVSFPLPDKDGKGRYVIVHLGKKDRVELIRGEINDAGNEMDVKITEDSLYVLARTSSDIGVTDEESGSNILPWCIGGIIALIAVVAVAVLSKRFKENEE